MSSASEFLKNVVSNTTGCKPNFLIRITVMDWSKYLLILKKCTHLKYAGTNKEGKKDREAEARRSLGLLRCQDAGFLEWITVLTDFSFLICDSMCTTISLLFYPSSLMVLNKSENDVENDENVT